MPIEIFKKPIADYKRRASFKGQLVWRNKRSNFVLVFSYDVITQFPLKTASSEIPRKGVIL